MTATPTIGGLERARCNKSIGARMDNAKQITVNEVRLACKHCGSDRFTHTSGQLNTAAMTFFNLDWLNASADIYVCEDCGFLHWFLGESIRRDKGMDESVPLPEEPIPVDDTSSPSNCLACGKTIPAGIDGCPGCGWSYRSSPGT